MLFFKKYVLDVIYNILFIPVCLKIILLSHKLNEIYIYKMFFIIYFSLLYMNSIYFLLFFYSNLFYLNVIFFYIIMFYIPVLLKFKVNYISKKLINRNNNNINFLFINDKHMEYYLNDLILFHLNIAVYEMNVSTYFHVKDYIICLCLAEKFQLFIDLNYNKFLIKKIFYVNNTYQLPSNIIRLGKITDNINENNNFDVYFKHLLNEKLYYNIQLIYMLEKNYRLSFYSYGFFHKLFINNYNNYIDKESYSYHFNDRYKKIILNYELFKTFYGEDLINEYFKEEMEEYEELYFIYCLLRYYFEDDLCYDKNIEKISMKNYNNIPLNYNSNKDYNEFIKLFDLLLFHSNLDL
jgi:hypothetical protein